MVTITMMRLSQGWDVQASCLSDDTKPTECTPPGVFPEKTMPMPNGAKLVEIDTGARFLFNEKTSEWDKQPETDEEFAQDVVELKADMQEVESEVGDLKSVINDPVTGLNTKAPVIIDTASGAIASFPDGADGLPLKKLTVNIKLVQAGSGDPSPENVRPISGWTQAAVSQSGADTSDPDETVYPFPAAAGTVYGGTLTINDDGTGEIKVTMARTPEVHDNVKLYSSDGDYTVFRQLNALPDSWYIRNVISNMLKRESLGVLKTRPGFASGDSTGQVFFSVSRDIKTVQDMSSWLNDNPLYFVYELAEPITYPLTQQQVIDTLYGTNNIWADCGDVSVDYPADTKLYIQKINAPTDDDMTADTQIDNGKYFLIGNTLYLSTTVIPAGDTIIPGTNCTKTDLAAALNALNA